MSIEYIQSNKYTMPTVYNPSHYWCEWTEPNRKYKENIIWKDGTNPIEMEFKDNAMIRTLNERKEKP